MSKFSFKKGFSQVHLWLSVPLGVIIILLCLTGAALVFRTELEEASKPELYRVKKISGEKRSIAQVIPLVNAQLTDDVVTGITIPSAPDRTYSVSVESNPRAAVYVDPYTGKVLGKMENSLMSKIMQLHRWLLMDRAIGKPIVGYTTLLFVVILITGIVICFPKNRTQLKRLFTIKLKQGSFRLWRDSHVGGGMYLLIGLLVLSLTGLTWSFQWYRTPFYKLFGAEAPAPHGAQAARAGQKTAQFARAEGGERRGQRPEGHASRGERAEGNERRGKRPELAEKEPHLEQAPMPVAQWDNVLLYLQAENPNYKRISLKSGSATVTQNQTFGNSRASDRYSFDEATGAITEYMPYADQNRTTKVRGWIYSVHVGSWGGLFSKIITCFVALAGATLPITGYYLWIKRLTRKKKKHKEQATHF